jgi:lipopolysaccharide export system protein LptA
VPAYARLALVMLAWLAVGANALPGDRDQPIHIAADQALRDEQKGHTVYSGNVRMVQGSMEVDADRITIWHNEEDADKIVARGAPARMRQQPEIDQELVHAQADTITYWQRAQKVNLTSNARIEQRGDVVTGDLIIYFIERQLVKAESGKLEDGNRVNVIIQPSTQQGERTIDVADPATAGDPPAVDGTALAAPVDGASDTPAPVAQDEEPSGATASQ